MPLTDEFDILNAPICSRISAHFFKDVTHSNRFHLGPMRARSTS